MFDKNFFQEQKISEAIKIKVKLGKGVEKTSHVITNVGENDEGRYFCTARNQMGSDEAEADVTLMGRFFIYVINVSQIYRGAG